VQRQLKEQLGQLLHRMPIPDAEAFLERVVDEARAQVS
jgi:hypothetical protein